MLIIKLIQFPFYRIFIDIFPDFQIILFIPNHMVVKRPLPDFSMRLVFLTICLPCRERFKRADHIRYSRGGALLRPVYGQQEVYVIRHDNIFLHANPISQFQRFDLRLTDTAKRAELSPAPTNIRQNTASVLGADGNKIRRGLCVIPRTQAQSAFSADLSVRHLSARECGSGF